MEIRKLLRGYGIRNFNLSNSTQIMVILIWLIVCDIWRLLCLPINFLSYTVYLPQTLITYILKQDLPMSLEDSLTLAAAYKLPTSQINYLYLIQLIRQCKVCSSTWEYEITNILFFYIFFWCFYDILIESLLCCLQTEECLAVLKKLSPAEAECVIERLTSWARLQLEDKAHISDEVRRGKMWCFWNKKAFYRLVLKATFSGCNLQYVHI